MAEPDWTIDPEFFEGLPDEEEMDIILDIIECFEDLSPFWLPSKCTEIDERLTANIDTLATKLNTNQKGEDQ